MDRYNRDDDDNLFAGAATAEVDFGAHAAAMQGVFDHNAVPYAPDDSLIAPPSLAEQAALARRKSPPVDDFASDPLTGGISGLVERIHDIEFSDDDQPLFDDPDDDDDDDDDDNDDDNDDDEEGNPGAAPPPEDENPGTGGGMDVDPPLAASNFREEDLKIQHRPSVEGTKLPASVLAQLDLALLLRKAGAPLYLHDKIIKWGQHYTEKNPNLWTESKFLTRPQLMNTLATTFNTVDRQPHFPTVPLGAVPGERDVNVVRFPFEQELLSLLENKQVLAPENIVDDYDLLTGRFGQGEVWVHESIREDDLLHVPTPRDPTRVIGEVVHGTKFQMARRRYCTEDHHMPVPLIFFSDKANLDSAGALATTPVMFSLGFLKNSVRTRRFAWRMLGLVPNLGIGKGRSKVKSANTKAEEYHKVLREIFREVQDVVNKGGIRVKINNQVVVLKIWIHFVIGDTDGHNDLCGQKNPSSNRPVRDCTCPNNTLSKLPLRCKAITRKHILDLANDEVALDEEFSYRPMHGGNVFDDLPMGNHVRGIAACGNYETLHLLGQGVYQYIFGVLMDNILPKKKEKEELNDMFRAMSRHLDRQSERDFPRRAVRFSLSEAGMITSAEVRGNALGLLLVLSTRDGARFLHPRLLKYRTKHCISSYPKLGQMRTCLMNILCYEKWVKQPNVAAEVVCSTNRIESVMSNIKKAFPRQLRQKSRGWDIIKFHAMGRLHAQMCADGDGRGWDSGHGESFHKEVAKKNARETQKRFSSFTQQVGKRCGEGVTLATAYEELEPDLMPGHAHDASLSPDTDIAEDTTRRQRSYTRDDLKPADKESRRRGKFHLIVPPMPDNVSDIASMGKAGIRVKWEDRIKHAATGADVIEDLVVGIRDYASRSGWKHEVRVVGYTMVEKTDPTTGVAHWFRADPNFRSKRWRDWAIVDTYPPGTTHHAAVGNKGKFNPGYIAGFVQFTQPHFPTPRREALADPLLAPPVDQSLYAVVRCTPHHVDFDNKFITRFSLQRASKSMYVVRMSGLVAPLAVVPDIDTSEHRAKQDLDAYFAIKPQRCWGDHFGKTIDTSGNDDSEDEEEDIDVDWDEDEYDDGGGKHQDSSTEEEESSSPDSEQDGEEGSDEDEDEDEDTDDSSMGDDGSDAMDEDD